MIRALTVLLCLVLVHLDGSAASGKFVAVIAVVSRYQGTLEPFRFDGVAARIETSLRKLAALRGYAKENVSIYTLDGVGEKEPTDSHIKMLLKQGVGLSQDDTFVFQFLGHGATIGSDLMLLTSGAESTNDFAAQLASSLVVDSIMAKSKAGLRLVFLDVCQVLVNAQGAGGTPLTADAKESFDKMARDNPGLAIYLSTSYNKPAWIEDEKTPKKTQIGFFTKQVIEAFENPQKLTGTGASSSVMADDLATYLTQTVPAAVKAVHPLEDQEPTWVSYPGHARAYLFGGTGKPPVPDPVPERTALAFRVDLPKGTRLASGHLTARKAGDITLGKAPVPASFDTDVRGACLARDVKAGDILRFNDLALLEACKR